MSQIQKYAKVREYLNALEDQVRSEASEILTKMIQLSCQQFKMKCLKLHQQVRTEFPKNMLENLFVFYEDLDGSSIKPKIFSETTKNHLLNLIEKTKKMIAKGEFGTAYRLDKLIQIISQSIEISKYRHYLQNSNVNPKAIFKAIFSIDTINKWNFSYPEIQVWPDELATLVAKTTSKGRVSKFYLTEKLDQKINLSETTSREISFESRECVSLFYFGPSATQIDFTWKTNEAKKDEKVHSSFSFVFRQNKMIEESAKIIL